MEGSVQRRGPLLLLGFLTLILLVVNASNWFILSRVTRSLDVQLGLRLVTVAEAAVTSATSVILLDPGVSEDPFVRVVLKDLAERNELEDLFLADPAGIVLFDLNGDQVGVRNPFLDLDREPFGRALGGVASSSPTLEVEGVVLKAGYAPVHRADGGVGAVLGVTAGGGFYEQVPALRRTLAGVSLGSAALVVVLGAVFFGMQRRLARTEAALSRAETLSTMGMMAAGIAHEVRNPLSIIQGTAQRLRKKYGRGGGDELFDFIPDEVERLNRIVEGYLSFAQDEPVSLERCDLRGVVERFGRFVQEDFAARNVEVVCNAGADPVAVLADARRLEQVLLNLVLNAVQAMPDGGRVELELVTAGGRAQIRISDTGRGLDARELRQAFTPFYTTHEKGSGLGLVLARRIVEAHGGSIELKNRDGGGATAVVTLPIPEADQETR